MTDIVERLRSLNADFLHEEAASEIERLRKALNVAREVCGNNNCNCPGASKVKAAIRAALVQEAYR